MENYAVMVAEYGFIVKMTAVAFAVIVAGVLIRKRPTQSRRRAVS